MQVIGHRGAAAIAPENTWESFDIALDLGVDAIETDIRASSDGELVLIHDSKLDRTTNGRGLVNETPWMAIQALNAGSWFSDRFANAKIPRLDETLVRYATRTHLVLEIKQLGVELEVLELVEDLNLLDSVTFTAFDFEALQKIKNEEMAAKVGWLTKVVEEEAIARALSTGFEQICLPGNILSLELVKWLKSFGLEVRAWKISDEEVMRSAVAAQVDGMTIDFPDRLLSLLGQEMGDC